MPSATDLLLDTHVWVWLMAGDSLRIGPRTRRTIAAAADTGRTRVSPISAWEVGMLGAKGRLQFAVPHREWVARASSAPGISVIALTPDIAVESSFLPGRFHGDPADRLLVATARMAHAVLVTADQAILDFAREGHVHAADCSL